MTRPTGDPALTGQRLCSVCQAACGTCGCRLGGCFTEEWWTEQSAARAPRPGDPVPGTKHSVYGELDPAVRTALGDDLQKACARRAQALVDERLRRDDLAVGNEAEQLWLEIGIAAGAAATMQELIHRGVIDSDRAI